MSSAAAGQKPVQYRTSPLVHWFTAIFLAPAALAVMFAAGNAYKWAIENGIAKEQARSVLPEGCTKTRLYMNGTLRSWVHYIELRGANGTQKEHMEIAHACAKAISKIFPLVDEIT